MKAAYCSTGGGPEVMCFGDVRGTLFRPDEVLLRVEAVSIEGGDIISRRFADDWGEESAFARAMKADAPYTLTGVFQTITLPLKQIGAHPPIACG